MTSRSFLTCPDSSASSSKSSPPSDSGPKRSSIAERLFVPYTVLHPETQDSVARHAPEANWVHITGDSDYWALLARCWAEARDFVVMEHDMVLRADVLPALDACPNPWCTFTYPGPNGELLTHSLGLVRFRCELMRANPGLMEQVGEIADALPAKHWLRLDVRLAAVLRQTPVSAERPWGHAPCPHNPPLRHLHYEPPSETR